MFPVRRNYVRTSVTKTLGYSVETNRHSAYDIILNDECHIRFMGWEW
jgi:hypothetical protein